MHIQQSPQVADAKLPFPACGDVETGTLRPSLRLIVNMRIGLPDETGES